MVEEVQFKYKHAREAANYSIFDIECLLEQLAAEGVIWMIKPMKDLTEAETILINHYLNEKRELQIYDLVQTPVIPPKTSKSNTSIQSNKNSKSKQKIHQGVMFTCN